MKITWIIILVFIAGCQVVGNKDASAVKGVIANAPACPKAIRSGNIDSARRQFGYQVAQYLTRKYTYDIFARPKLMGTTDGNLIFLDLYCDWFESQNVNQIFEEIKSETKEMGFYGITFLSSNNNLDYPNQELRFVKTYRIR